MLIAMPFSLEAESAEDGDDDRDDGRHDAKGKPVVAKGKPVVAARWAAIMVWMVASAQASRLGNAPPPARVR